MRVEAVVPALLAGEVERLLFNTEFQGETTDYTEPRTLRAAPEPSMRFASRKRDMNGDATLCVIRGLVFNPVLKKRSFSRAD